MQEANETLDLYTRIANLLDRKVDPLERKVDRLSTSVEALTTSNAVQLVQTSSHEQRILVLEKYISTMPDREQAKSVVRQNLTWQNIGGLTGIAAFLFYLLQHVRFQ